MVFCLGYFAYVSSSYNISVSFLDSWFAHALKVLRRAKVGIKLSGIKDKTTSFCWIVRGSHSNFDQLINSRLNILLLFVSAHQFQDFFRPSILLCILTRYLPMCSTNWKAFFLNIYHSPGLKRCGAKILVWPQVSTLCIEM